MQPTSTASTTTAPSIYVNYHIVAGTHQPDASDHALFRQEQNLCRLSCIQLLHAKFRSLNRNILGLLALRQAGRQAFDRSIRTRMNEVRDRNPAILPTRFTPWIDDTVNIRDPSFVRPTHHDVSNIDDERSRLRSDINPFSPSCFNLQAAHRITFFKNSDCSKVSVCGSAQLILWWRRHSSRIIDNSQDTRMLLKVRHEVIVGKPQRISKHLQNTIR